MRLPFNEDFSDLFSALNDSGAKYLLVGGYAMAAHGEPRATKDIDVWIEPTPANAKRAYAALVEFGAPVEALGVTAKELATAGMVFQIGVAPRRIDLLTTISGVTFKEAWAERVEGLYGEQPIYVIGRRHLIRNKEATGRRADRVDIATLRKRRPNARSEERAEPPPGSRPPRKPRRG